LLEFSEFSYLRKDKKITIDLKLAMVRDNREMLNVLLLLQVNKTKKAPEMGLFLLRSPHQHA
jgi:hypothetical protein